MVPHTAGYSQCGTSLCWIQSMWYLILLDTANVVPHTAGYSQCGYLILLDTVNVVTHPMATANVSFVTNFLIVCNKRLLHLYVQGIITVSLLFHILCTEPHTIQYKVLLW
jgi:hypothetical protein